MANSLIAMPSPMPTPSPADRVQARLEIDAISALLTLDQNEVLEFAIQDYTAKEIGDILGIDRKAVEGRLLRARRTIERKYAT